MLDLLFMYLYVVGDEMRDDSGGNSFLKTTLCPCSYASDVTSGLSDGYEGLSEKSEKTAARKTAGKMFRRRARSRLRITGVRLL